MKIGHRGAAGYAPENTIKSIEMALKHGVDGIEFDVRLTRDNELVLCHDPNFLRTTGVNKAVSEMRLAEIRRLRTLDGEPIPTLAEALAAVGNTPVIVEIKDPGSALAIAPILNRFKKLDISVASFNHAEMAELLKIRPETSIFLLERTNPFEVIQTAKRLHTKGIGMNYWILNPLTYQLAKRRGLVIYVYTVNRPLIGHFIHRLYPLVRICTNYPDRIVIREKFRRVRPH